MIRWPIRYAEPSRCVRKFRRGEVRRMPINGKKYFGYRIGCPNCGHIHLFATEEHGFVEEGTSIPKELVGAQRSPICPRCAQQMRIDDGYIAMDVAGPRIVPVDQEEDELD